MVAQLLPGGDLQSLVQRAEACSRRGGGPKQGAGCVRTAASRGARRPPGMVQGCTLAHTREQASTAQRRRTPGDGHKRVCKVKHHRLALVHRLDHVDGAHRLPADLLVCCREGRRDGIGNQPLPRCSRPAACTGRAASHRPHHLTSRGASADGMTPITRSPPSPAPTVSATAPISPTLPPLQQRGEQEGRAGQCGAMGACAGCRVAWQSRASCRRLSLSSAQAAAAAAVSSTQRSPVDEADVSPHQLRAQLPRRL